MSQSFPSYRHYDRPPIRSAPFYVLTKWLSFMILGTKVGLCH